MWRPQLPLVTRPKYAALAEALAQDIAAGAVAPGERLPTQRELADAAGVTVPTVTRAYAVAARRGLITATVGRGTFVRGSRHALDDGPLDLSINALPPHAHRAELAARLAFAGDAERRTQLLDYPPRAGHQEPREAGARYFAMRGVHVPAARVMVTAGAHHALLVALASAAQPGETVLVEQLTYGGVVEAARLLGLTVRAVAIDEAGLVPSALERAMDETGAVAIVLQPVLHNPTGVSWTAARRRENASIIEGHGVHVIEDDTYGFLAPDQTPLAAELRGPWSCVTGLSKSVTGGLRIGFLAVPESHLDRAVRALWATTIATSPITAALAAAWLADGIVETIIAWKRVEMAARQALARELLPGAPTGVHPASPHVWWQLPRPWKPAAFLAEARARGIVLGAPEGFLGQPGAMPRAVRICLGPPATRDRLRHALTTLRDLAAQAPLSTPLV